MTEALSIVATSDLHGALPDISNWPDADVLVLAGDTCFLELGATRQADVREWLFRAGVKYEHVLGIAGNHDFAMRDYPELARNLHWTYLCDEAVEIKGFKFYGTPWTKTFFNWAFMQPDSDLEAVWTKIPDDTDVLIVHGPPQGVRDQVRSGNHIENVGSATLRRRLIELQPSLVLCGHIHEAWGTAVFGSSIVSNVSWQGDKRGPAWHRVGRA